MRSVLEEVYIGLMTDRLATGLSILKISNGDIFATGHMIHFMFGSRVGFLGSADRMALFPFDQIQDGGSAAILNANSDISATDHPIHSMFGSKVGFSGSVNRMAVF